MEEGRREGGLDRARGRRGRRPSSAPKGQAFRTELYAEAPRPSTRSGVAEAPDFSAIIAEKRGQHLPGTREWVFEAVMRWRTDLAAAKLFSLVGGGGTGKSVAAAELFARLLDKENVAAWHFCKHTELGRVRASGAEAVARRACCSCI